MVASTTLRFSTHVYVMRNGGQKNAGLKWPTHAIGTINPHRSGVFVGTIGNTGAARTKPLVATRHKGFFV